MFSFNDILKQIDPLANDEVSREFLRIAGADPQLMRELALQQIAQQYPFTANVPGYTPQPPFNPQPPASQPVTQPVYNSTGKTGYTQQLERHMQQMPGFTPPPQPQPVPPPPRFTPPPQPKLYEMPEMPVIPEPGRQWSWSDFLPALFAAVSNQDALPYVAQGIEQALQSREQRAMNRYELAMQNALREWQAKVQAEQMNTQLQNAYQQQAYESQLQHQQAVYQTQAANIQQQNQYAQQRWASEQEYKQWEWGQKLGILGRLADREMMMEERELNRQLQAELKDNQLAMTAYNSLMEYVSKPQLSAAERQSALQLADSLAAQFPKWQPLFEGMKQSIKVKPSVSEQKLDIQWQDVQRKVNEGQQRIALARAKLQQAQAKAAKGQYQDALKEWKSLNEQIGRLEDDIRAVVKQMNETRIDPISLREEYVIKDPGVRQRIQQDLQRMEAERDRLIRARDNLMRDLTIFKGAGAQVVKPKAQSQQQQQQWSTTKSGNKFRVVQ